MANGKRPQAILGMLAPTIEAIVEPTEEDIARFRREGKKLTQQELAKFDNPDPFRDETSIFSGIPTFTDPVTGELSEARVQEAVTLAASMPIASAALGFRIPQGAVGIFGGVGARTAPKDTLKQAIVMESGGSSRGEILEATGWARGVDGKWKFEISDARAEITPHKFRNEALKKANTEVREVEDVLIMSNIADGLGHRLTAENSILDLPSDVFEQVKRIYEQRTRRPLPASELLESSLGSLSETRMELFGEINRIRRGTIEGVLPTLIRHPDLFEAYPELKRAQASIRQLPPNLRGEADTAARTVAVTKDLSDQDKLSTLLHEIQHLIQRREGFAIGTNVNYMQALIDHRKELESSIRAAKRLRKGQTKSVTSPYDVGQSVTIDRDNVDEYIEEATRLMENTKKITPTDDAFENYLRAAGEVDRKSVV